MATDVSQPNAIHVGQLSDSGDLEKGTYTRAYYLKSCRHTVSITVAMTLFITTISLYSSVKMTWRNQMVAININLHCRQNPRLNPIEISIRRKSFDYVKL